MDPNATRLVQPRGIVIVQKRREMGDVGSHPLCFLPEGQCLVASCLVAPLVNQQIRPFQHATDRIAHRELEVGHRQGEPRRQIVQWIRPVHAGDQHDLVG